MSVSLLISSLIEANLNLSIGSWIYEWAQTGDSPSGLFKIIVSIVVGLFIVVMVAGYVLVGPALEAKKQKDRKIQLELQREQQAMRATKLREAKRDAQPKDIPQPSPIILRKQARLHNTDFTGGTSWLGGLPALGDVEWPRSLNGEALHLLAQIDCETLSALKPDLGFPAVGSLVFFANITEWPYDGKVIYVPTPAGGPATVAPDDLLPLYGDEWHIYSKGYERNTAPKKYARWPVDMLPFDLPRSALVYNNFTEGLSKDKVTSKAVALLPGAQGIDDATTYSLGDYLPNGEDPWLWDTAQRFAAALRVTSEYLPDHIQQLKTRLEDYLAGPKPKNRHKFTKQQLNEMKEKSRHSSAYYQAKLDAINSQKEGFDQFVGMVTEWADIHDAWTPMPKQDLQTFNDFSTMVFGYGTGDRAPVFKDIYNTPAVYLDLSDIVNDTLRNIITGPQEVYDLLPEKVKSEVDHRCLIGREEEWHQMFGIGHEIQSETSENQDKYMLLQIHSDKLMGWMWGDVGIIKYWITPENLKNGRWETVFTTVEC